MNSQNNDNSYYDKKRLSQEIERIDELKNDLKRYNDQLSDDLAKTRREMEDLLSSNLLNIKEYDLILNNREKIIKLERDKEEEFDSYISNLNNSREEHIYLQNRVSEEPEEENEEK